MFLKSMATVFVGWRMQRRQKNGIEMAMGDVQKAGLAQAW
jgi:hypothetical protein